MPKDERHWHLEIACTTKPGVQEVERRLAESNQERHEQWTKIFVKL